MENKNTALQMLDEINSLILQAVARRFEQSLQLSINQSIRHYTDVLTNTILTTQAEVGKNPNSSIDKTTELLKSHSEILQQKSILAENYARLIPDIVGNCKITKLLTQHLETAFKATREFIASHQRDFQKEHMQQLLVENLHAQKPSREVNDFLKTAITDAVHSTYKSYNDLKKQGDPISNDILSKLGKSPQYKKETTITERNQQKTLRQDPTNKTRKI